MKAPQPQPMSQTLAGLQLDLAADHVELGFLRLIDIGDAFRPVAAGAGHARVERGLVSVGLVVVHRGDALAARDVLHVEQARLKELPDVVGGELQVLVDFALEDAVEELREVLAVPPAVHVGLAEPQRALREEAVPEPLVVDLRVPWVGAVDDDPDALKGGGEQRCLVHPDW